MKKKLTFCFDIDNIICKTNKSNYRNSKPIKKNINLINQLKSKGYIIKIFTARYMGRFGDDRNKAIEKGKKLTVKQLKKWNVMYDKIFFGKPSSDFYIDDKSIDFKKNWKKIIINLIK